MRSPKLTSANSTSWYRYYAGYSPDFVEDALVSANLGEGGTVLDPWNGAGTTTAVAQQHGLHALGYDANPALVLIARARLLASDVDKSLVPLAEDVIVHANTLEVDGDDDPLAAWLQPAGVRRFRAIERGIQRVLVTHEEHKRIVDDLDAVSPLAALFYVALFDAIRTTLRQFVGSNPTWVKTPKADERISLRSRDVDRTFVQGVATMRRRLRDAGVPGGEGLVRLGNSTSLPLEDDSVSAVITSPPYCTRIDYVAATRPELAVMGLTAHETRTLRDSMLGTPTIVRTEAVADGEWRQVVADLIGEIEIHRSRASGTYYRKYFTQYFKTLWVSLAELRRVVAPGGRAVIVVQDSYYKDLHIDLPRIVSDMASKLDWPLESRHDFAVSATKAAVHRGSRAWRTTFSATEAVLVLE